MAPIYEVEGRAKKRPKLGKGGEGQFRIDRCLVKVGKRETCLVCHVKATEEYYAEQAAMEMFDNMATALVLDTLIPWYFIMEEPVKLSQNEVNKNIIFQATDNVYSTSGTNQVEPSSLVQRPKPITVLGRLKDWLNIVRTAPPEVKRLIRYYCRGVAMFLTSPGESLLNFMNIVEYFTNMYCKDFKEEKLKENPQWILLGQSLRELLKKYRPNVSESKVKYILNEVKGSLFYTNRDLLEYTCMKSCFFDKELKREKQSLEALVDNVYAYLPPERRRMEFKEIYAEHEAHITQVLPKLLSERATAAHFSIKKIHRSAVGDSHHLARYLLLKAIRETDANFYRAARPDEPNSTYESMQHFG